MSVTNNGISLIPTFSLEKPAAIFDMSVGRRLRFEPQFRFSLEGKPWSFLFWWRYTLLSKNKSLIKIGVHPALNFKTTLVSINGVAKEMIISRRYLAGELSPNYFLTKNISVGTYYLYSRGLDEGTTRNTHFVTINSNISDIKFTKQFFIRLVPQFYYLKLDDQDGFYFTSTVSLTNKIFPLSLSTIINKKIESDITASQNFVWNATLSYAFGRKYVEQ